MTQPPPITDATPPANSLLAALQAERRAFADAYWLDLPGPAVELAAFVEAFYTTRLFKLERLVLRLAGLPSSDASARAVARGETERFAAWRVLTRREPELLLIDVHARTCSWFQVEPLSGGSARLWFGSAVIPARLSASGEAELGWLFDALLGFHRRYSRALLKAAAVRLSKKR